MRRTTWVILGSVSFLIGATIFQIATSSRCVRADFLTNSSQFVEHANDAMKARGAELHIIGLESDGSDLHLLETRLSKRNVKADQPIDHEIDAATHFLYAKINGYRYRFAFDECGNVLDLSNLTGFTLENKQDGGK